MSDENGFWNKIKSGIDTSLSSSRKVMDGAKKKSKELEEYGILKIDIKRLETRNADLFSDLGMKVFSIFSEEGRQSVTSKNPVIRDVMDELESNRLMLEEKQGKLKNSEG
ncbi:MAG: hypothetical protein JEY99_08165 [Spirochaetales bacterium]|nr:hypothetical protein [Spirochaetales bacterium]